MKPHSRRGLVKLDELRNRSLERRHLTEVDETRSGADRAGEEGRSRAWGADHEDEPLLARPETPPQVARASAREHVRDRGGVPHRRPDRLFHLVPDRRHVSHRRATITSTDARRGRPNRPENPDLLEDRLQQVERREHVLACELAGAVGAARGERGADRGVLALVQQVQLVDRLVAGRPDGRPGERAACVLGDLLDVRQVGDPVDHVVEAVVRAHPVDGQRASVLAGLARPQRPRQAREALLGHLELLRGPPRSSSRRRCRCRGSRARRGAGTPPTSPGARASGRGSRGSPRTRRARARRGAVAPREPACG